jgi:hypothetical protein
MQNTVRIPLTLDAHVHAMKKPVASSQTHQSKVNSLQMNVSEDELK